MLGREDSEWIYINSEGHKLRPDRGRIVSYKDEPIDKLISQLWQSGPNQMEGREPRRVRSRTPQIFQIQNKNLTHHYSTMPPNKKEKGFFFFFLLKSRTVRIWSDVRVLLSRLVSLNLLDGGRWVIERSLLRVRPGSGVCAFHSTLEACRQSSCSSAPTTCASSGSRPKEGWWLHQSRPGRRRTDLYSSDETEKLLWICVVLVLVRFD